MSTVTKMQATGEIVVGLDKSAAGWRAAASAPSTGQPLRAVHVLSCSPEGVIAVTPAAEDGPAEVRESAEACVDQSNAGRDLSGSWTGSQDLGPVNRDLHLVVPQRTRSSKTDLHSTRIHDVPKLCKGNSHDRTAAEATNGFLLADSA